MTKRRAVGMEATDAEERIPRDELENIITQGLKLKLESVRRKNPYFKGSRRGSEHMWIVKMSQKEKLSAMSFTRCFVKAYFMVFREDSGLVSPN